MRFAKQNIKQNTGGEERDSKLQQKTPSDPFFALPTLIIDHPALKPCQPLECFFGSLSWQQPVEAKGVANTVVLLVDSLVQNQELESKTPQIHEHPFQGT